MAKDFDNTNRGSIWKNEKKEKDGHPDFTGSLNVEGKEFWVSAWKRKEGASAKAPALSFSIKPKDEQAKSSKRGDDLPKVNIIPELEDDMNGDEIPF